MSQDKISIPRYIIQSKEMWINEVYKGKSMGLVSNMNNA